MPGSVRVGWSHPGHRRRCRHPGGDSDGLKRPLASDEARDDLPAGGLAPELSEELLLDVAVVERDALLGGVVDDLLQPLTHHVGGVVAEALDAVQHVLDLVLGRARRHLGRCSDSVHVTPISLCSIHADLARIKD